MSTMEKLQDIFRDFFDDQTLVLTRETSPDDGESWDSLAHVSIIGLCASDFGINFDLFDIPKMKNAGDIADMIEKKLNA